MPRLRADHAAPAPLLPLPRCCCLAPPKKKNNIVGCNAFISTPLEIKGAALANVFHEVKVNLVSAEAERICIDRMVKGQEDAFSTPEGLADVDSRMASLVRVFCWCGLCGGGGDVLLVRRERACPVSLLLLWLCGGGDVAGVDSGGVVLLISNHTDVPFQLLTSISGACRKLLASAVVSYLHCSL